MATTKILLSSEDFSLLSVQQQRSISKQFFELASVRWGKSGWSEKSFFDHLRKYPKMIVARKGDEVVGFLTFNPKLAGTILASRVAGGEISKMLLGEMLTKFLMLQLKFPHDPG